MIEWGELMGAPRATYVSGFVVAGRRPDGDISRCWFFDLTEQEEGIAGPYLQDITIFDIAAQERWQAARTHPDQNLFVLGQRPFPAAPDTTDYAGYYEAITE